MRIKSPIAQALSSPMTGTYKPPEQIRVDVIDPILIATKERLNLLATIFDDSPPAANAKSKGY